MGMLLLPFDTFGKVPQFGILFHFFFLHISVFAHILSVPQEISVWHTSLFTDRNTLSRSKLCIESSKCVQNRCAERTHSPLKVSKYLLSCNCKYVQHTCIKSVWKRYQFIKFAGLGDHEHFTHLYTLFKCLVQAYIYTHLSCPTLNIIWIYKF